MFFEVGAAKQDDVFINATKYDANRPLQILNTQIYKYTYINGKKYYIVNKKHEHALKPDSYKNSDNYLKALQSVRVLLPDEYIVYNNQLLGWVYKK